MLEISVSASCDASIAPVGAPSLTDDEIAALIVATAPEPVPTEYADRVVSIIGPNPLDHLVRRFRKEYRLSAGCDCSLPHNWTEETDPSASLHGLNEARLDNLGDFVELLNALSKQSTLTIALGRLKDESRDPFMSDNGWWLVPDRRGRYEGCRTRWLPIDLDHLPGDPLDADDVLDDYIAEHLPELEGCGQVWRHTGSSGIKGTRVRLWYELAEPRHLAGLAAYAKRVNERAGFAVIDAGIYQPGRLVFTADPELLDANGDRVRRPVPSGAWHVKGDLVPADAFPDVLPGTAAAGGASAHAPREKLSAAEAAGLIDALGPGNYNGNIHRWLCGLAWRTPEHRAQATIESAIATIQERVEATSEPERLAERLRIHANPDALRRKWQAARERQRVATAKAVPTIADTLLPSLGSFTIDTTGAGLIEDLTPDELDELHEVQSVTEGAPVPRDDARRQLVADFKRVSNAALVNKAKVHALFTHAPGVGKSKALEELTEPGSLCSSLVRVRVPDHRLAEQLVTDLQNAAAARNTTPHIHGDTVALIRHHKGRSRPGMCPDDESRPKADRAEKLSVSPKKAVCPDCATGKAGLCPWLKQDDDDECGIIVEAHASAVAITRQRRSDLNIIDESIIGGIVEADPEHADLTSLTSPGLIRKAPNELGSLGRTLEKPTETLHRYRQDLVKALRNAAPATEGEPGTLRVNTLTDFWRAATFKARDGLKPVERSGTALDQAIELEAWLQESLVQQIMKADESDKDSSELRAQLGASRTATSLYGAIAASMKCERDYVFGVAAHWGRRNKKRCNFIKIATRAAELQQVFGDASITLDGTADESVWRAVVSPDGTHFDSEVIGANVAIEAGALHAVQYVDKAGSRSSLTPRSGLTEDEREKVERRDTLVAAGGWARNALGPEQYDHDVAAASTAVAVDTFNREQRKLHAQSWLSLIYRSACFKAAEAAARAVEIDGRSVAVLLVAQKAIGEQLKALGLPSTVAVEHFGKLLGINHYERVPVAIVAGRMRPANIDLELLTEALHMHNPAVKTIGRYDANPKEGRHWLELHPDPLVAAVQSQITAAGVQQAVARVRLFDRTAERPVELHVFGQYDAGLPADQVQRRLWIDADRSPIEIAAARGCVFLDQRLNRHAYGPLFPRGDKRGCGRVDLEGKAKWYELLANLARNSLYDYSLHTQDECTLNPNRDSKSGAKEAPESGVLLAIERTFDLQTQHGLEIAPGVTFVGDALDFTADGSDRHATRHRLVKLRVPGVGYASHAIVAADWTEADVAHLLGAPIDAWIEQGADDVRALVARRITGAPDLR